MFNLGPAELMILAFVALIVIGPEKLPGHARDAARLLRNLRDMATGARSQLRDELGPELSGLNLDALRELRSLNPKSALMNVLFDDGDPLKDVFDDSASKRTPPPLIDDPTAPVRMTKPSMSADSSGTAEQTPFDVDTT